MVLAQDPFGEVPLKLCLKRKRPVAYPFSKPALFI